MTLELRGLSHRYEDELAVDDVSLRVESGQVVGLLGPSGCGKTTIVQSIAGHIQPTAGRVLLRDVDVTRQAPEERDVGVVFQQSTLFPHLTVGENVAYGLDARGIDGPQREARVESVLDLVSLRDNRESYPAELSGGQRRRAELARALAPEPDVLLLDEPLTALDRALRLQLRAEIGRIQRETGVTTLFVTHDQEGALSLADALVVMNDGQVAGTGEPRALYQSPPTRFVASFLGRSNSVSGSVVGTAPLRIGLCDQELELDRAGTEYETGTTLTCQFRPEDSTLDTRSGVATRGLSGEVVDVSDVGRRYDVTVGLPTGETLLVEQPDTPPESGTAVTVVPANVTILD